MRLREFDRAWADRVVGSALEVTGPTYPVKHYTKSGMNEEKIIDHWESPRNKGSLPNATSGGRSENLACGDSITIDLLVANGTIEKASFDGRGCVLCLAGASMLVENIIGKPLNEAAKLTERDMFNLYEGVPIPVRMRCCLLPLEALKYAAK